MLQPGDIVAVLDEDTEGKVVAANEEWATIETSDGFQLQFKLTELIKINSENSRSLFTSFTVPETEIKAKEGSKKQKSKKVKPKERKQPAMVIDLHAHKLIKSTKGMDPYDILNLQLDTVKRQLEFAINKRIQKIVFIHGVGEGVLRSELEFLLNRYENLKFYDADYQKYGMGATEVYIYQNTK